MTKLLISGFPKDITERQIEDLFIKEGRIVFSDINVARGQGQLEYDDPKSAQKAIETLNGSTQFGSQITVELQTTEPPPRGNQFRPGHFRKFHHESYSRSRSRSHSSSRSYSRDRRHNRHSRNSYNTQQTQRKMPTSRDKCYVCGKYGHWASKCKEGDGTGVSSGKCFKCGERGHIARKCPNTRKRSNFNSVSRSASRSGSSYSSERSRHKKRRTPSSSSRSKSSKNSSVSSDKSRRRNKRNK